MQVYTGDIYLICKRFVVFQIFNIKFWHKIFKLYIITLQWISRSIFALSFAKKKIE